MHQINSKILLLGIILIAACYPKENDKDQVESLSDSDFSIAFIPDPHLNYQTDPPITWIKQANWLANPSNLSKWRLIAITGGGDFYNTFLNSAWIYGGANIDKIGIPWLYAIGNHDYDGPDGVPALRQSTAFDSSLGYKRIANKPFFYSVFYDTSSLANQCIVVSDSQQSFLIIALEYYPRPEVLNWAQNIITTNSDKQIIIITHAYMKCDGTLIFRSDKYGPRTAKLPETNYSGSELLDWGKQFQNLKMIVCGHWIEGPEIAVRADTASDGHTIYGVYTNFQYFEEMKKIVLFTFKPQQSLVELHIMNTTTGKEDQNFKGSQLPYYLPWVFQ